MKISTEVIIGTSGLGLVNLPRKKYISKKSKVAGKLSLFFVVF